MRYVCPATVMLVCALAAPLGAQVPQSQGLSITNYQFVSEQRISQTQSNVTYRADLVNTGGPHAMVTAGLTSPSPNMVVIPGQNTLMFSPVPAQSTVTSQNTFTITVNRSVVVDLTQLQWTFLTPIANAGPNQTAKVGSTVTLNGTASTNPSGYGALSYHWTFTSRPPGTSTVYSVPGAAWSRRAAAIITAQAPVPQDRVSPTPRS